MVTRVRLLVIALAVVFGLVAADHVGATSEVVAAPVVTQTVDTPANFGPHPEYTRVCNWSSCTWYLNKRETRIAAYGGAILTGMICSILRSTIAAALCVPLVFWIGKAGDNAIAAGKCVKFTTGRWYPAFWGVGTYGPSWRCV